MKREVVRFVDFCRGGLCFVEDLVICTEYGVPEYSVQSMYIYSRYRDKRDKRVQKSPLEYRRSTLYLKVYSV